MKNILIIFLSIVFSVITGPIIFKIFKPEYEYCITVLGEKVIGLQGDGGDTAICNGGATIINNIKITNHGNYRISVRNIK